MASAIAQTIQSVQYVKKCHVMEESGHIAQVFVEAQLPAGTDEERTRSIKSIVRSIIGAVAMHHNVQLDYRKIKVVEYKPSDESMLALHPRIQIGAAFARRAPQQETVVELHLLGRTVVGTWPSTDNPAQDTFYACTNALASLGFTGFELIYLEILHNDFANEKIVLLKVKYTHVHGQADLLLGVAEVKEDLPLAVVKAFLDAINRRIGLPTRTEPSLT